jgi:hypothetical protein
MILNDPTGRPATPGIGTRATIDDLFRRAAQRRPNDVALIDPPNREGFTDGPPRRMSYAQCDLAISAIAGRLHRLGLHTDAVVGLQLANTVEAVLTFIAVQRAGLIAMPMPLLWRRADAMAALSRVGANALIVSGRVGKTDHFDLAMQVAAEIFPVRYVCGYGRNPPDGLVPFDDLLTTDKPDPVPAIEHERALPPGPGAHLAVITWDVTAAGLVPVGRSHAELIAGGLALLLEGRFGQDAIVLSTLTMSSFAGLAVAMVPWLLVGGTLVLHHPFDYAAFVQQRQTIGSDTVILPGQLVAHFAEAGLLSTRNGLTSVVGVWRAPEQLPRAPAWRDVGAAMIDVHVFGETGLLPARRGQSGRPAGIPFGTLSVPRGNKGSIAVAEVAPTARGTVALRGPMVPRCPFPPGAERTALPHFKVAATGFVDTGYACRTGQDSNIVAVTGPPPGVVSIGGYRFVARDLQEAVSGVDAGATVTVLPDALAGHRLSGSAGDLGAVHAALGSLGVNPLLARAFLDRTQKPAAAPRDAA